MAVREAQVLDVAAVMPLLRAYCEFYESSPPDEGIEAMLRDVIGSRGERGHIFLAIGDDGALAGFAHLAWKWSSLRGSRIGFLEDLFVAPESRGAGHAEALIERCAEAVRSRGLPAIEWLTAADNARAQAVYDRVGGRAETLVEYELDV